MILSPPQCVSKGSYTHTPNPGKPSIHPSSLFLPDSPIMTPHLNDRLQLSRITQRILNRRMANLPLLALSLHHCLRREVNPSIPHHPPPALRKLHHCALRVEEEEVLRAGDGEGRVCALGARRDFGTDAWDQDLFGKRQLPTLQTGKREERLGVGGCLHTSEKIPNSSLGTSLLLIAFHT